MVLGSSSIRVNPEVQRSAFISLDRFLSVEDVVIMDDYEGTNKVFLHLLKAFPALAAQASQTWMLEMSPFSLVKCCEPSAGKGEENA